MAQDHADRHETQEIMDGYERCITPWMKLNSPIIRSLVESSTGLPRLLAPGEAMTDHVLNWLKENDQAPTVDAYCELNFSMSWRNLQRSENAEWVEEVLNLVEDGELRLLTSGTGREQ